MQILNRIIIAISLFLLIGCTMLQPKLPTILTSKEQQWTIPAGVEFQAIQKPAYPKLTKFIVTDGDLAVVYKGSLLELEQEANRRVVKASRAARQQGAMLGVIGSIVTFLGGLFTKNKVTKKKEA